MTADHDPKPPRKRAGEPVQVYLTEADQARLERLTAQVGASKSDVLRRGLEALELQHLQPAAHPALRLIGLVDAADHADGEDVARDHDRILAESEDASWRAAADGA
jgi:Arc/MetJ-type ribon-helix-helix transcriptional regulator